MKAVPDALPNKEGDGVAVVEGRKGDGNGAVVVDASVGFGSGKVAAEGGRVGEAKGAVTDPVVHGSDKPVVARLDADASPEFEASSSASADASIVAGGDCGVVATKGDSVAAIAPAAGDVTGSSVDKCGDW